MFGVDDTVTSSLGEANVKKLPSEIPESGLKGVHVDGNVARAVGERWPV